MTNSQKLALGLLAGSNRVWEERPSCITGHEAGAMVRRGWLKSTSQSENVRGEGRHCWRLYAITDAGRRALKDQEPHHD